jgi:hypothetical protein
MMRSQQFSRHTTGSAFAFPSLGEASCRSLRGRQRSRLLAGVPALPMSAVGVDVGVDPCVAERSVRQSSAISGTPAAANSP